MANETGHVSNDLANDWSRKQSFFSFFYHTVMPWVAQRSDRKNYQPLRQRSFVMPTSTHVTNSRVVDSSVDNVWKQV